MNQVVNATLLSASDLTKSWTRSGKSSIRKINVGELALTRAQWNVAARWDIARKSPSNMNASPVTSASSHSRAPMAWLMIGHHGQLQTCTKPSVSNLRPNSGPANSQETLLPNSALH